MNAAVQRAELVWEQVPTVPPGPSHYWRLRFAEPPNGGITIEPRPPYCDRGHWIAKVHDPANKLLLDDQDGFPRYYMSLRRAKDELTEWLVWRLTKK